MKKIICSALICAMVSLMSCDKIQKATSKDFTVKNVSLDFSTESKEDVATKSSSDLAFRAANNTFTETRIVDISELGSSEIIEYVNKINKVIADNSLVKITTIPAGNFTVENLTITATGVSGSLAVPSLTVGNTFTLTSAMKDYMNVFIMKLIAAKSLSVTVTGTTDAPAGTVINISYISDLIITASLL